MGIKKKTIVGHLVFNPLCTHKFKPDAFGDQRCEDGKVWSVFAKKNFVYKFEEFPGNSFQPWYLVY
jgi:hypothetical protein